MRDQVCGSRFFEDNLDLDILATSIHEIALLVTFGCVVATSDPGIADLGILV